MKYRGLIIAGVASVLSTPTMASNWDIDYSVSLMPMVIEYRVHDPEGKTATERANFPATLRSQVYPNRINRFVFSARAMSLKIPAGNAGVGLDVEGYQISSVWQRQLRLTRNFQPWLGGGIVSSFMEYENRLRTEDGFLVETFDDREGVEFSLTAAAGAEWELTRDWFFEAELIYEYPLSDGLEGYGAGVGIGYKF